MHLRDRLTFFNAADFPLPCAHPILHAQHILLFFRILRGGLVLVSPAGVGPK